MHDDRAGAASRDLASDSLAELLRRTAQHHRIPGIAAAVVRSDSIVQLGVAGVRRRGASQPVTLLDRFHLGSNTKALTALLLASLVEEGTLSWSVRPVDVLPELAEQIHPRYRGITLDQLVTHRAGMPAFTSGFAIAMLPDEIHFQRDRTPAAWRRAFAVHLLAGAPKVDPGTSFLYSNAGYTIAAVIAEAATGESWEALMATRVFRPLRSDGGFGWPAARDNAQPWGHRSVLFGGLRAQDPEGKYELGPLLAPAGDVQMDIGGYARFLQDQIRGLAGEDGLVGHESVRLLHTPVDHYARGWLVQQGERGLRSAHEGSAGTFHAIAVVDHTRGLGVAILSNSGSTRAAAGARKLATELLARY